MGDAGEAAWLARAPSDALLGVVGLRGHPKRRPLPCRRSAQRLFARFAPLFFSPVAGWLSSGTAPPGAACVGARRLTRRFFPLFLSPLALLDCFFPPSADRACFRRRSLAGARPFRRRRDGNERGGGLRADGSTHAQLRWLLPLPALAVCPAPPLSRSPRARRARSLARIAREWARLFFSREMKRVDVGFGSFFLFARGRFLFSFSLRGADSRRAVAAAAAAVPPQARACRVFATVVSFACATRHCDRRAIAFGFSFLFFS